MDMRTQFNRYAEPDHVEWHFSGVVNPWTKRALVASGFGADTRATVKAAGGGVGEEGSKGELEMLIGAAEVDGDGAGGGGAKGVGLTRVRSHAKSKEVDLEAAGASVAEGEISPVASSGGGGGRRGGRRLVPVYGVNRPYFHLDVETAVAGAIRSLERRGSEWSGRE